MDENYEKEQRGGWRGSGMGGFGYGNAWRMGLAKRGWLRPVVLKLLGERPMNGIEIMDRIQEMSMGWYRPSPGSVYPLLEQMSAEGLISKNKDGKYELTKKYTSAFGPVDETGSVIAGMESAATYLEELQKSDKSKFLPYKRRVERIAERLSKL
ncbi:MAG: helix-turn-helix transcriptional regulator [Nitrososphaerota archaeon]|jgi:DNA-binding PadR family transcriptional regulator|nr:helix-turn-helix transcriptional regulator [Nitrososphaerota archaeon]